MKNRPRHERSGSAALLLRRAFQTRPVGAVGSIRSTRGRSSRPCVALVFCVLVPGVLLPKLGAQSGTGGTVAGPSTMGSLPAPHPPAPPPAPQVPDAGTTATYTLPQLIDMGERANPQTRTAWERTRQAADQRVIARSPLFPTLSITTVALRGDLLFGLPPNLSSDGVVKLNSTIVEPAVRLTWTAIDFGANLATYRAARQTEAATGEEATATEQQVALTVSEDYYSLVAAQQSLESANAAYDAAKIEDAATELSYVHGLVSVIKRDQTKAQTLSAYASLVSAKARLQQAKVALAAEVNLQAAQAFNVPPLGDAVTTRWVTDSVEALVKTATALRPELHEALDQIRAAQQERKSAHAGLFPTVSVTAQEQYTHSTSSTANAGSAAQNALTTASTPDTNGNTYVVSANLTWDIFTAGAKRARVRSAASQVQQLKLHLDQLTLDVQQQVWGSYTNLEAALSEQQAAEAALTAAREYYDSAKVAAAHGLGNEVPLTSAQASLAQAESASVTARTHTLQLAAELAYSTGQLLSFGPMMPRPAGGKP